MEFRLAELEVQLVDRECFDPILGWLCLRGSLYRSARPFEVKVVVGLVGLAVAASS